ncbi:OLC1v1007431C1 [Oldenlandia corymbosa var. corymbosa]|uniref:OLC1v1007431C1 n=1 Tax=Oldenlandia corymbosa var. corymbosa TaxID=529605 RepID=A0AAV1DJH9_OLDCO|nr:OLC1v1007431C1 [Oldenlandia corymbosa var. corymbosa]
MSLNPVALPEDLVREILARLPAKSLLWFRCVSKQWKALIGSQYFVNLQLKSSKIRARDNPQILLMINDDRSGSSPSFLIVNPDSPPQKMRPTHLKVHPFSQGRHSVVNGIHGCCNGLVCLSSLHAGPIVLWNPAIRKRWVLPVLVLDDTCNHPPIPTHYTTNKYGFGYDDIRDDYKVVRILGDKVTINAGGVKWSKDVIRKTMTTTMMCCNVVVPIISLEIMKVTQFSSQKYTKPQIHFALSEEVSI